MIVSNIIMGKKKVIVFLIVIAAVSAYFINFSLQTDSVPDPQKELLIYCGITMIKPMSEIASIIEQQEDVKISIIKGGSGNLLRSIKFNKIGDLYLPGSDSYIKKSRADGLISESVHVGYNKAAMMVRKGNPKQISPYVNALKNKNLYVVIGNPDSGSIGNETKKILTSSGIFDDVIKHVGEMTTDSKRLVEVLKNGEADLVINWFAVSTWVENRDYIDVLPIENQFAKKKRLVLGLLSTSKYPDIARKFMAYAASDKGRAIFNYYGLYETE